MTIPTWLQKYIPEIPIEATPRNLRLLLITIVTVLFIIAFVVIAISHDLPLLVNLLKIFDTLLPIMLGGVN